MQRHKLIKLLSPTVVIGKATIINCDCMEYMATLPDKAFDLAIVDPPYGIGMSKGGNASVIPNKSVNPIFDKKYWDDDRPKQEYFDELKRVSVKQVIWGGNSFLDFLGYCKAPVIWDKLNGDSLYADGEMAWTGGDGIPRNLKIWRHQWCGAFKASERGNVNIHPTQKPVKLYEWLLTNYAKPGQRILDTHLGSGSSAIAANNFGFEFVGCELDKDYFDSAVKRIKAASSVGKLFTPEQIYKSRKNV